MKNFAYPFSILAVVGIVAGLTKPDAGHQLWLGILCLIVAIALFKYGSSHKAEEWEGWL